MRENRPGLRLLGLIATCLAGAAFPQLTEVAADEQPVAEQSIPHAPKLPPVAPPSAEELNASIERGVQFLLKTQHTNGAWGSAEHTKDLNIYAPVPGAHLAFRGAVTSLCVSALLELNDQRPEVLTAVDRAEAWLLENLPHVRRATPDALYNVWTHAYSIQALLRLHEYRQGDAEKQKTLREMTEQQIGWLTRYESVDGGWGYYDMRIGAQHPATDSMSFVNAAVLIVFFEAKEAGIKLPQNIVDRAIAATKRQRLGDNSYLYGEYLKKVPRMTINRPGGSLGRTQACNVALRLWGDDKVTDDLEAEWLDRLFARNGWLDMGRKRPIPHEAWFSVAGYFYYFGHYYAARAIEQLPVERRPEFQAHMGQLMIGHQEKDGSWWDYPLYDYHQAYGTAFVLMTLNRCRPAKAL